MEKKLGLEQYTIHDIKDELTFYQRWYRDNVCNIMQTYIENRIKQLNKELTIRRNSNDKAH